MNLIDKIGKGLLGLSVAGAITMIVSFYSCVSPIVYTTENPKKITNEFVTQYAEQLGPKTIAGMVGFGAMIFGRVSSTCLSFYSGTKERKKILGEKND
jgi:hypothetical protein